MLKPFWKNNEDDIIQGVTSGLKNVASTYVKSSPFSHTECLQKKDESIAPLFYRRILIIYTPH
jgi:hypothetical protein